ncbi:MAG: ABC transporter ATP-binding protein [Rhizobiaceae bacterium]|nr:ABC transporter ATP-binding protein [Rhizobiaceae bacterium]
MLKKLNSTSQTELNAPVAVKVASVDKIFPTQSGQNILALKNVSLDIKEGEFVAVVGPSGCGKSTLMRIVCGLDRATNGSVYVGNQLVRAPGDDVGVVFQNAVLLPWLDVRGNILLPVDLKGRRSTADEERLQELLKMTRLEGFDSKYPFELSGGMKQRVAICRALMCEPSLLVMDEPFGALDAMTRESMNLELMRICAETNATVMFITHSVAEAVLIADRVAVMTARPGEIAEIIDIDIPRPRDLSVFSLERFNVYTTRIRELLGAETIV